MAEIIDAEWANEGFSSAQARAWVAIGPRSFQGTNLLMDSEAEWPYVAKTRVPVAYGISCSQVQGRGFNLFLRDATDKEQEAFFRPVPFSPAEAAEWRAVVGDKPLVAADWRRFGLTPDDYTMYTRRRIKTSWSAYVTRNQLGLTPGEGLDRLGSFSVKTATGAGVVKTYRALDAAIRDGRLSELLADDLVCEGRGADASPRYHYQERIWVGLLDVSLDCALLQQLYEHVCALAGADPTAPESPRAARPYLAAARGRGPGWPRDEAMAALLGTNSVAGLDQLVEWSAAFDADPSRTLQDARRFLADGVPVSWGVSYLDSQQGEDPSVLTAEERKAWHAAGFTDEDIDAFCAVGVKTFEGTDDLMAPDVKSPYVDVAKVPIVYGTNSYPWLGGALNKFLSKASAAEQEDFFRPPPFELEEAVEWRSIYPQWTTKRIRDAANWRRFGFTPADARVYLGFGFGRYDDDPIRATYLRAKVGIVRDQGIYALHEVGGITERGRSVNLGYRDDAATMITLKTADRAIRQGKLSPVLATALLGIWGDDVGKWHRENRSLCPQKLRWDEVQRAHEAVCGVLGIDPTSTDGVLGSRPYLLACARSDIADRDQAIGALVAVRDVGELAEFAALAVGRVYEGPAPSWEDRRDAEQLRQDHA